MKLVTATASRRPPPLNIQWWRSRSDRQTSTVNPAALLCPHWVHPTSQACQAYPSKPFFNQHNKFCDPYLPLQAIFWPTCQAKPCEIVPSFFNRLPAPPWHFRTDTPKLSPVRHSRNSSTYYLPLQAIFKLTRQLNLCDPVPSFLNRLPAPPIHFQTNRPSTVSQSRIFHQITCPSKPFLKRHTKRCELDLHHHFSATSFLVRLHCTYNL